MVVREVIGLGLAFVVLAGVTFAIFNHGGTSEILKASFDGFGGLIKTATGQGVVGGYTR